MYSMVIMVNHVVLSPCKSLREYNLNDLTVKKKSKLCEVLEVLSNDTVAIIYQ